MELTWAWLQFFLLTGIIAFFGYKLSYLADQISSKTKLSRNLIGLTMLSTVTSLPELATGISSVTITNNPNLAVGDILGGCSINLVTVVLLDFFYKKGSVYSRTTQGHMFTGLMAIILFGIVGLSLILKNQSWLLFGVIGLPSVLIIISYLVAMKAIYNFERVNLSLEQKINPNGLKKDLYMFAICSLFIVVSGIFLPITATRIIKMMDWNPAFFGTFFLAIATTLPEISVTISALKINAAELAFSNLLGSNIFNILILAVSDIFYKSGSLLGDVSGTHAATAFSLLMMVGLVLVALMKPPQKKIMNIISIFSVLILGVYLMTIFISYKGSLMIL
jgi:cation:H+ antiporter